MELKRNSEIIDFIEFKNKKTNSEPINKFTLTKERNLINQQMKLLKELLEVTMELDEENVSDREVLKEENKDIIDYRRSIKTLREEESMKREIMKNIFKRQIKFLLISIALIIFALCNLIGFSIGNICINPYISIFIFIMGVGWSLTAIAAIFE